MTGHSLFFRASCIVSSLLKKKNFLENIMLLRWALEHTPCVRWGESSTFIFLKTQNHCHINLVHISEIPCDVLRPVQLCNAQNLIGILSPQMLCVGVAVVVVVVVVVVHVEARGLHLYCSSPCFLRQGLFTEPGGL